MKKILLVLGGLSLILGAETVYAYIQDCPRRIEEANVSIEQFKEQDRTYNNTYHHEEYHSNCNYPNCNRANNQENEYSGYQYQGHHRNRNYGHHTHARCR